MIILLEVHVIHYVAAVPSIGVEMFIPLEGFLGTSEVDGGMFITLERPPEAGKDNNVLIKHNIPVATTPGVSYQMGILPKPLDGSLDTTVVVFSIHCYVRVIRMVAHTKEERKGEFGHHPRTFIMPTASKVMTNPKAHRAGMP